MPMKKKLNVDQIQSELRGGSAFFPGYKKSDDSPTPPPGKRKEEDTPNHTARKDTKASVKAKNYQEVPQGVPPPVRGTVPPIQPLIPKVRRAIKQRQPFDIFEDQYEKLKRIAATEKEFENGRSMSQMVRDAIDQYFINHPEREN
jgi:hypothetical protein